MRIEEKRVAQIAKLAKLRLTDTELKKLGKELQQLLDYAEVLQDLELTGIEPVARVHRAHEPMLETRGKLGLSQTQVQELAPDSHKGLIRVPAVMVND